MKNQIIFADGTILDLAQQPVNNRIYRQTDVDREWRRIRVDGTYADVAAAFGNDVNYRHEWESQTGVDEQGQLMLETLTEDFSAYSIAGEIVDHRDGTITVYMGKPTELEQTQAALDALVLDLIGGGEDA